MPHTIKLKCALQESKEPLKQKTIEWKVTKGPPPENVAAGTTQTDDAGLLILTIPDQAPPRMSKFASVTVSCRFGELDSGEKGVTLNPAAQATALFFKNPAAGVAVAPNAAAVALAPVPVAITNPDRDWLTYESLFNKDAFRKPNCKFDLSLYLIPMNDIRIWLRNDLPPADLQAFVDAFFPDFEPEDIRRLANGFWSWKQKETDLLAEVQGRSYFVCSPRKIASDRERLILYVEPYAVLPYNRFDNTETSNACGTRNHEGTLLKVKSKTWNAWKTASRSCVFKLPDAPTKERRKPWIPFGANSDAEQWSAWQYSSIHRDAGFEQLHDSPFKLSPDRSRSYSIKTGVEFVGKNNQGGALHKDVIGDWLVGCLRSDYLMQVEADLHPPKDGVVILTELITITEKKTRQHKEYGNMNFKEGIQVRDLAVLKGKIYLAPLNIPFVGLDLKEFKSEYRYFDDKLETPEHRKIWQDFWKVAYAANLGRAKALLTLRFGLQIINPNQQNFLIEFKEESTGVKPTGNIAARDLADASIHREAVWALFEGPGLPPQDANGKEKLALLNVPTLKFEFESGRMAREGFDNQDDQETGTTNIKFGPPGTQFLWQRFSAFANLDKGKEAQEHPVLSHPQDKNIATPIYKNLLTAMADWGMAHNKSYIACVEAHLGKNFRAIDWSLCPNPSRLQQIQTINGAKSEIRPKRKVMTDQAGGPRITGVVVGPLPDNVKTSIASKIDASVHRDAFRDERCLQVSGADFADDAELIVGTAKIKAEFYICTPTLIVMKDLIEINGVEAKKSKVAVVNPAAPGKPAECRFEEDRNYMEEIDWEERSAKVIHDFLAGDEGQTAIKRMKVDWKPRSPIKVLQFIGPDAKPFAWQRVFMKEGTQTWTDLTDGEGRIHIYDGEVANVKICPQKDEDCASGATWLPCENSTWEGIQIKVT